MNQSEHEVRVAMLCLASAIEGARSASGCIGRTLTTEVDASVAREWMHRCLEFEASIGSLKIKLGMAADRLGGYDIDGSKLPTKKQRKVKP